LALFGVGMTGGTLLGGRLADRSIDGTIVVGLTATIATLLLFTVTAHQQVTALVTALVTVLLLGAAGSLMLPALQTRLMDVAPEGPSLAATLNHSALNIANALGAFLGGLVIAAGYGYTAPAVVGAALAVGGLVVLAASVAVARRSAA
jgi:DHA1 family inner membrane transport protein